MAFEPKYIDEAPLLYYATYAVGYSTTNSNKFHIYVSDDADSGKTNSFQVILDSSNITILFSALENDSILNTIISKFCTDFVKIINLVRM